MSIVHDTYIKYLRHKKEQADLSYSRSKGNNWTKGNLWSSDLGKCHRAAILRVTGTPRQERYTTRSLDYMNTGVVTEDETLQALQHVYEDRLTDQVTLKYNMWSGKADFGIDVGTDDVVLIEHKTTSEKHWDSDSKSSLPRHGHIGQAVSYMYLYELEYGITPKVLLFYKSWGNYAEFELVRNDDGTLNIISDVNGVLNVEKYEHDFYQEIRDLTDWYNSTELPPRQEKKWKHCTFMGKPSCPYYSYCWGEE